jgi:hypothetical protein
MSVSGRGPAGPGEEVVLAGPPTTVEPEAAPHGSRRPARHRHRPRRRSGRAVAVALTALAVLVVLVVTLPLALSSSGNAQTPQPVGGPPGVAWKLRFDENFTGTIDGLLDSGTWHTGWFGNGTLTRPVNTDERALMARANISVAGGQATFKVTPNTRRLTLPDGTTHPNLGATINSDDQQASRGFLIGYGYVEARMQLPAGGPGERVWPSFWLNGHTWPDDMEIDVVEGDGTDQGCKFNLHYGHDGQDTLNLNNVGRKRTVPGATTGMHTYAADIRPDGVTFYYDGEAVYAYHGQVPDAQRFLMVGVSASGTVTGTRLLRVDYVRAWTRA